jgi:hypothetical protein
LTRPDEPSSAPQGTYWATPNVLAGPYPASRPTFPELDEALITRRINLTEGVHKIVDHEVPTVALMEDILTTIHRETRAGGRVYVHCLAGQGRTGTVIGCLLAELGEKDPLTRLTELRRLAGLSGNSPEEAWQNEMVTGWIDRAERARSATPIASLPGA